MEFRTTSLEGVLLVVPKVFEDSRGFFFESYRADKFKDGGIDAAFVQDNHSRSALGTLRGLHAQWRRPQGKLVRCVRGEIFDVAVDARPGSKTLGKWVGVALTEANRHMLWVPPGLVHGFCVTSDFAEVEYKCTALYDPGYELTVAWNDPGIGIEWPVANPILSAKDAQGLPLRDCLERLSGAPPRP